MVLNVRGRLKFVLCANTISKPGLGNQTRRNHTLRALGRRMLAGVRLYRRAPAAEVVNGSQLQDFR